MRAHAGPCHREISAQSRRPLRCAPATVIPQRRPPLLSTATCPAGSIRRPPLLQLGALPPTPTATRSSDAEAASTTATAPGGQLEQALFELTKDNFWEYMGKPENQDVLIIVDCYTDWCGPCKMIYPDLVKLSEELEPRARVVKFNCNKYNKELGVQLNIKVAPTFLLYRNSEKVGEMTGAKLEKLKLLIAEKLDPAPAPPEAAAP